MILREASATSEIIDTNDFKDFPIDAFYHYYVDVYSYLRNNDRDSYIERKYIDIGDEYLKKYSDTAIQLCNKMNDLISSGRESASFAITMDAYLDGKIKGKKKTTNEPVNDFGIKVGDIFYTTPYYYESDDPYKFYQVRELAGKQSVRVNEVDEQDAISLYNRGRNEDGEYDLLYPLYRLDKTIRAKKLPSGTVELNMGKYELCWQYTGQSL